MEVTVMGGSAWGRHATIWLMRMAYPTAAETLRYQARGNDTRVLVVRRDQGAVMTAAVMSGRREMLSGVMAT
jgi:hypothetical protein